MGRGGRGGAGALIWAFLGRKGFFFFFCAQKIHQVHIGEAGYIVPKKKERGPQTPQIQGQVFGTRPGAKGSKVFRGATAEGKKFGGLGGGDCTTNAILGEVSVKVAGYLGGLHTHTHFQ